MDVTVDILAQALDPKGEGDDATGYREKVQIPGGPNMTFFVVKEDGQYERSTPRTSQIPSGLRSWTGLTLET